MQLSLTVKEVRMTEEGFFFAQLQLQNVVNNNVWVTCILWFHITVLDNLGNKKCRHEN